MRTSLLGFSVLLIIVVSAASCSSSDAKSSPPPLAGNPVSEDGGAEKGSVPADSPRDAGSPAAYEQPTPASTQSALFVGRFDTTDPAGPKAAWPGTRILARFDGTAVSVKLSEFAEPWMDGAPSYWEVSIDHGAWKPIAMTADNQPRVFEVASGLSPGVHEVELYKRSEAQTGITQFLGFDFHGGKALAPPERQKRKIEVLGDSQSAGFGIEMLGAPNLDCPGADHSGVYENFRKSWGALLGVMFDAEVHGIVYSGKGLVKNLWKTDTDPLRDYYPRTNPNPARAHEAQLFDLQSWIPDVTIITQGSCDFAAGLSDGEFRAAYRDFVINKLRARSPNTHIFMGVLGKGGRGSIDDVGRQIVADRRAVGDDKMHVVVAPLYTEEEMTACNGHGKPAWHERIANQMGEEIRKALGW